MPESTNSLHRVERDEEQQGAIRHEDHEAREGCDDGAHRCAPAAGGVHATKSDGEVDPEQHIQHQAPHGGRRRVGEVTNVQYTHALREQKRR